MSVRSDIERLLKKRGNAESVRRLAQGLIRELREKTESRKAPRSGCRICIDTPRPDSSPQGRRA